MNIKDIRQKRIDLEEEINALISDKLTSFERECDLYIDGADIQVKRHDVYVEHIAYPIARSIGVKTKIEIKI